MAIDRMKRLPSNDPRNFMQQANIRCSYCKGAYHQPGQGEFDLQVHNSWLFFPCHGWYLYFYERILGKLIGDPLLLYHSGIGPNLRSVANNLSIIYSEMIRGSYSVESFMGDPYRARADKPKGPGLCERGSHTAVHLWVRDPQQPAFEDLGNFYSAGRDPLFYCHHAIVDRMWTLWRPPAQAARGKVFKASSPDPPNVDSVFLVVIDMIIRVVVPKTKKGKTEELLALENMEVDTTKLLKVNVFENDKDNNMDHLGKASYVEDMEVEDDDTILVTLMPRHQGTGIKIIEAPPCKSS
ncbi:unnamed protein product [Fraxinus pennsylvanica]|uniref:Tyrosinase copper-binding domain-containing protein n=1 Tax=Fraxinus pennsylvanica TaxID=56036 RepID=A0AAD2ECI1_9LAMI|nr:unnamed protein product [Fraxinus pennsylvanica]